MGKLRDHFIICGAGRVGSHLIRGLKGEAPAKLNALARGRAGAESRAKA